MKINQPILHIDTCGMSCFVALTDGDKLLREDTSAGQRSHSEELSLMIYNILARYELKVSGLHGLSINIGPGSYTGLRVAIAVVKGMLYGLDIPIAAIPLHEALLYDPALSNGQKNYHIALHMRKEDYMLYHYNDQRRLIDEKRIGLDALMEAQIPNLISTKAIADLSIKVIPPRATLLILPAVQRIGASETTCSDKLLPIYFQAPYITTRRKELL